VWCGGEVGFVADAGEGEEGSGGAVGGGGVGVGDLFAEGVEGGGEERAEAVGGVVVDFAPGAFEGLHEIGVVVPPAVEGAPADLEEPGDEVVGGAGEEELDGGFLALGEVGVEGVFGLVGRRGRVCGGDVRRARGRRCLFKSRPFSAIVGHGCAPLLGQVEFGGVHDVEAALDLGLGLEALEFLEECGEEAEEGDGGAGVGFVGEGGLAGGGGVDAACGGVDGGGELGEDAAADVDEGGR
jgi:hypothetical protein